MLEQITLRYQVCGVLVFLNAQVSGSKQYRSTREATKQGLLAWLVSVGIDVASFEEYGLKFTTLIYQICVWRCPGAYFEFIGLCNW